MTFDPDDPRLTAFALGELEGAEREAVELLVDRHAEARRYVEETRILARLLGDRLRSETAAGLTEAQRRAIEHAAGGRRTSPRFLPFPPASGRWLRHALAAAAMLAVGAGTFVAWQARYGDARLADSDRALAHSAAEPKMLAPMSAVDSPRGEAENEGATAFGVAVVPEPEALNTPVATESLARRDASTPGGERDFKIADGDAAARYDAPPAGFGERESLLAESAREAAHGQVATSVEVLALDRLKDSVPSSTRGLHVAESGEKASSPALAEAAPEASGRVMAAFPRESKLGAGGRGGAMVGSGSMPALAKRERELTDIARNDRQDEYAYRKRPTTGGPLAQQVAPGQQGLGRQVEQRHEAVLRKQGQANALALGEALDSERSKPATALALSKAEQYETIVENDFVPVNAQNTLATFSADVDTGSYANIRRMLTQNTWPRRDAVRIEEMVNYFPYAYPEPDGDAPFSVSCELTEAPWNRENWLLRVGLKGRSIRFADRKATNLVFLVDVSGSMAPANKLPLVKAGLRMLAEQLGENDTITMVTYAGEERLALSPTSGLNKAEIVSAIDQLQSGGSTNGERGIKLAYNLAAERFVKEGVNRVILATDGDFNVGVSSVDDLVRLAEEKAKSGVFLSVLGVGEANLKEAVLERIADKGNGNYSYLDSLMEARKVLVEQAGGTLVTIAKDVKFQVDLNPAKVGAYRLIGYENRALRAEDFRNDAKDAGEIGSGHTVTALLELMPAEAPQAVALKEKLEPSKYSKAEIVDQAKRGDEYLNVALRYKAPDGETSRELRVPVSGPPTQFGMASEETRFASAVALLGMILRESKHKGTGTLDAVLEIAESAVGADPGGYRREFLGLVRKAKELQPR